MNVKIKRKDGVLSIDLHRLPLHRNGLQRRTQNESCRLITHLKEGISMYKHSEMQRIMAMVLSVIMILGLLPISAAAETLPVSVSGELLAFEKLASEVAAQTVPLGTDRSGLNLPDTLVATVRLASEKQDDNSVADSVYSVATTGSALIVDSGDQAEQQNSGEKDSSGSVARNIPATWTSSPEYNGNRAGVYTFTAEITGYTLRAEPPAITVTVGQTAGTVTAFDAFADDIRWQNTISPELPERLAGTVEGESAHIPVTWEADHDYGTDYPVKGLYVFTAVLGGGYTLSDGVETPRITVYIPTTVRARSMLRSVGAGTSGSPLEIATAAQLAEIATLVNAGRLETFLFNNENAKVSLKLVNDIDLSAYQSGEGWVPIGRNDSYPFKGSFDGGGYKIAGLRINSSSCNYLGLFGYVDNGTLQNIGIAGASVNGTAGGAYVGGVAGFMYRGEVENCYVTGIISGTFVGGIAGAIIGQVDSPSVVKNCYTTTAVTAGSTGGYVGGVVGNIITGTLENCYATGTVGNSFGCTGGVAGYVFFGKVQNCAALNDSISAIYDSTGRITGESSNSTLAGNTAFYGMTVTVNGSAKTIADDATGIDGAGKTAGEINATGFFETLFSNDSAWTHATAKLPGLFDIVVDMPLYLLPSGVSPFNGDGTAAVPYKITTAAQLAKLAGLVNAGNTDYSDKYYQLQNDLDLSAYGVSNDFNSGKGWVPIGRSNAKFKGHFDGDGHAISGLIINDSFLDYAGLFGYVSGGSVYCLSVKNASIAAGGSTGGVAGRTDESTQIYNCSVSGSMSGSGNIGGIAGYLSSSTVGNCYSTANVTGTTNIGGLAGYLDSGKVEYSYATGAVSCTGSYAGGVAGRAVIYSTVKNCAALNQSVVGAGAIGRVMGAKAASVNLADNYAFSVMTVMVNSASKFITDGAEQMDGKGQTAAQLQALTGFPDGFNSNSWTYAPGRLPGIFGEPVGMPLYLLPAGTSPFDGSGTAAAPYKISTAAQLAKLAEFVNAGNTDYNGEYYELQNDLDLSAYASGEGWVPIGKSGIGVDSYPFEGSFDGGGYIINGLKITCSIGGDQGLFGILDGGTVKNLGVVNVSITGFCSVGGVVGNVASGTVENCYVTGTINGVSDNIGGVAGNVEFGMVQNCYFNGTVSGVNCVGGVAGYAYSSTVKNCYATGTVSGGDSAVGGVVGVANVAAVQNCAALNLSVAGAEDVGRVVGVKYSNATLTNNYAYSGMAVPVNGSAKTITAAASGTDGANMNVVEANTASFWTTPGNWYTSPWDSAVWLLADGKLPILTGVGGNQSGDAGLYLTVRDIQYSDVLLSQDSYIYDGTAKMPDIAVGFDSRTLVQDTDYAVAVADDSESNGTNAGEVTLLLTGRGNFKGTKEVSFTISKMALAIDTANTSISSKTYDRSAAADISAVAFAGLQHGDVLTLGTDYNITSAQFDSSGAGSGKTVTVIIMLEPDGPTSKNYTLPVPFFTLTGQSIAKGTITSPITMNQGVYRNIAMDYPMDYAAFYSILNYITGTSLGEVTCQITSIDNSDGVLASVPPIGLFTFPAVFSVASVSGTGKTATITGTVSSDNYTDFTLNMVFSATIAIPLPVTFDLNGGTRTGGGALTQTVAEGSAATAPTVTRSGYTFNGWDKDFTNIMEAMTVTALWEAIPDSGSGSGSDGNSGSSEPAPTAVLEKKPEQQVSAGVTVAAKADKEGLATAKVSEKSITSAIAKAQADAKARGTTSNELGVVLNVTMPKGSTSLNLILNSKSLKNLIDANVQNLEINGAPVSLGFDLKAIQEIQKQSTGDVTISITLVTGLNGDAEALVGTRPVYNISISYVKDGKTINITSLGSGSVTLSIPYTPGKKESVGYLFGVYVDGKGHATRIEGSTYDANSKSIIFDSNHFSVYGVGYTAPSEKFKDISSHWAKESIDYVVGRGLLSGTSTTTAFSPNAAMSRGMLVTALGRLAGVDESNYKTVSFTDVAVDQYYAPYIEWAYKKGIVSGIGNGQFAPDRDITREEIARILSNYANATGYTLPVTRELTAFADNSGIGSTYQEAVKAMQQAGIMMGGTGNKFNPGANATRAEVSTMLHRYIKLTIDPATAQGWAVNDAGQRLYYKDGKALTGWRTIESKKYFFDSDGTMQTGWKKDEKGNWYYLSVNGALVGWQNIGSGNSKKRYYFTKDAIMVSCKWLQIDSKWYYFNTDGSLAVSTKIDGYEVDENGVRKADS